MPFRVTSRNVCRSLALAPLRNSVGSAHVLSCPLDSALSEGGGFLVRCIPVKCETANSNYQNDKNHSLLHPKKGFSCALSPGSSHPEQRVPQRSLRSPASRRSPSKSCCHARCERSPPQKRKCGQKRRTP